MKIIGLLLIIMDVSAIKQIGDNQQIERLSQHWRSISNTMNKEMIFTERKIFNIFLQKFYKFLHTSHRK